MERGVNVEGVPQPSEDRAVNRRRATVLAAGIALGLTAGVGPPGFGDAARNRKKKKSSKKEKKGKPTRDSSGSGGDVVRVAQKYEGSPYTWGGASPKGFDCSGFTWYVYQEATGQDITRGVEEQWQLGRSVGHGEWQPGDIVFFENTFERGLSHCGIYIGGNKFIHAENEQTGVIVSTMDSDYYRDHYAGARRLL